MASAINTDFLNNRTRIFTNLTTVVRKRVFVLYISHSLPVLFVVIRIVASQNYVHHHL